MEEDILNSKLTLRERGPDGDARRTLKLTSRDQSNYLAAEGQSNSSFAVQGQGNRFRVQDLSNSSFAAAAESNFAVQGYSNFGTRQLNFFNEPGEVVDATFTCISTLKGLQREQALRLWGLIGEQLEKSGHEYAEPMTTGPSFMDTSRGATPGSGMPWHGQLDEGEVKGLLRDYGSIKLCPAYAQFHFESKDSCASVLGASKSIKETTKFFDQYQEGAEESQVRVVD